MYTQPELEQWNYTAEYGILRCEQKLFYDNIMF